MKPNLTVKTEESGAEYQAERETWESAYIRYEDEKGMYVDIWAYSKKFHLIETNDPEKVNQIAKWSFATVGPSYGVNHYRRQFFIPRKKARLAHKLLGLEYKKHPSRVKAGKQAAKKHPVRRG